MEIVFPSMAKEKIVGSMLVFRLSLMEIELWMREENMASCSCLKETSEKLNGCTLVGLMTLTIDLC